MTRPCNIGLCARPADFRVGTVLEICAHHYLARVIA